MSTNREVVVSIGAEITGVKGAEVLNRQVSNLEQSTANGLARLQATASKMSGAGGGMVSAFQRADKEFQAMQGRMGKWLGQVESSWSKFSSGLQGFQGGLKDAASGVESLLKGWTILTGSEQDLEKVIKKLLTINAVFDSIRGVSSLFTGVRDIAFTFASGGPSVAGSATNGIVQGAGNAAAGGMASRLGFAAARAGSSASQGAGFNGLMLSSTGGVTTASPVGGAATAGGLSAGSIAGLGLSAALMVASLIVLSSRDAQSWVASRLSGSDYITRLLDVRSYSSLFGRSPTIDDSSASNLENAERRSRLSRRMQRETGISIFELESLDDRNYQFSTRYRQRMQPTFDRYNEMRTVMPWQLHVEGRNRIQQMRVADWSTYSSRLMQDTSRQDSTSASFTNAFESMLATSREATRFMPNAERVANNAHMQQMQNELSFLKRRYETIRSMRSTHPSGRRPSSSSTEFADWNTFEVGTYPVAASALAGSFGGFGGIFQSFLGASHGLGLPFGRSPSPPSRNQRGGWWGHLPSSIVNRTNQRPPDFESNGENPLQAEQNVLERIEQLHSQIAEARFRQVQLSAQEREQQRQILGTERTRYQQASEFYRNQAQALRDQQRSNAGSFGFMAIDQQQRALRIAQAIRDGRGEQLSREDIEFGRGVGPLSDIMAAEGRRRAGQSGYLQQIQNIAAPGEISANERIRLNEQMAARAQNIANNIQVALNTSIQLEPHSVAVEIQREIAPAISQMARAVGEAVRQSLKLEQARQMAQAANNQDQRQAADRANAGAH